VQINGAWINLFEFRKMLASGEHKMPSQTHIDIEDLVAKENAKEHDACAVHHDLNVPYINRVQTRNYYWSLILDQLMKNQVSFKNADVCELGCGTGTFVDLSFQHGAKSFTGVDISDRMIEIAKVKYPHSNTKFYIDTLDHFSSLNENHFNIILSCSFIHHLVDLEKSIDQIRSLLKPNGIYIGLHEPIVPRKHTPLEHVDFFLQILNGNAFGEMNIVKRLLLLSCGYWKKNNHGEIKPFIDIIHHYLKIKSMMKGRKNETKQKSEINLVDYQLNTEFSLNKLLSKKGTVTPYTYLCYKDLFPNSKINNYEMFVLKK
jgi:ubiquinone/menaquinone biosynthesis C-methylase UbiE